MSSSRPLLKKFNLKDVALELHPAAENAYQIFIEHFQKPNELELILTDWQSDFVPLVSGREDADFYFYSNFVCMHERLSHVELSCAYVLLDLDVQTIEKTAWKYLVSFAQTHRISDQHTLYRQLNQMMPRKLKLEILGATNITKDLYIRFFGTNTYQLQKTQLKEKSSQDVGELSFLELLKKASQE